MTGPRHAAAALRKVSALRDLCLRLPHVPTAAAQTRLRRFEALVASPESAGDADLEALAAGWKRWWCEGATAKLDAMANRVPRNLITKNRVLATYATAAKLVTAREHVSQLREQRLHETPPATP